MSCPVKEVTIDRLIEIKVLSKTREIIDFKRFDKLNDLWTKAAIDDYGLTTNGKLLFDVTTSTVNKERGNRLRTGEKTIYRATPNDLLFDVLDAIVVDKKNNESGNTWNEVDLTNEKNNNEKILLKPDFNTLIDNSKSPILHTNEADTANPNKIPDEINNMNQFILFNNDEKSITAKEVLQNIKNNFRNFTLNANDIIDKLIPILEGTNAKIRFVNKSEFSTDDTLMQYSDTKNEIQINRDVLNNINEEEAVRAFLHEVVHNLTVDAFNKPATVEQELFRSFILEMFEKYKKLSGYNENDALTEGNYGFTKPEEFIAELMTNPEFQDEIKALDKKGLWDKFVDFIRTLVGLKKTNEYNKIIDSITSISKNINSENNYSTEETLFQKKKTETEEDLKKDSPYYKLKTINDKVGYVLNEIKDALERNIRTYDHLIKTIKDPSKIKDYNDKQKEILSQIEDLDEANYWNGISTYVTSLASNIDSLERRFEQEDLEDVEINKTFSLYKKYLTANSLVGDIQQLLSDAKWEKSLPITKDELAIMRDLLTKAIGQKETLEKDFNSFNNKVAFKILNKRVNSREVLKKWRDKLKIEHKKLGITQNFESWFTEQTNEVDGIYKDEIAKDVEDKALEIIQDPGFDISKATFLSNSAINTNSDLVQIMNNIIVESRNNKIERNRQVAIETQNLFEELIKDRGNKKPSELYKNMYEKTKDGETILKGKYSIKFKEEYEDQRDKYSKELAEIKSKYGEFSPEALSFYENSEYKKWKSTNLKTIENESGKTYQLPADKWLTDESKMSKVEVKVLGRARVMFNKANKETFGINSLISEPLFTAVYYRLPSMTKSNLERALEANPKGIIKNIKRDFANIRPDDLGYIEEDVDVAKNQVFKLRVNYRGKLDNDQQSLDLMSMMLAEAYNGINFQENHKAESDANVILDLAGSKDFYKTTGLRDAVLGKFVKHNKRQTQKGIETNTYKRLQSLMESNIYDILHKNMGKFAGVDINKAINTANAWTGMIGMSVNEVASAVNVMNGATHIFLEGLSGDGVTLKTLMKAEAIYIKEIKNSLSDLSNPVSLSFINQTNEMFDTFGSVNASVQQAFIKNTMMRAKTNFKSLQFMQETGEHWIQSVITMAVLDNIQVLNEKGEFINKEGKVVATKKEAASMLDMLSKNKEGKLELSDKVIYTTHTLGLKYKEGGKESLTKLIKKKVFDTNGNYDPNTQPEMMRHGGFKLISMYRKYLIPMGVARFRGFANSTKSLEDLESHQKFFSEALQEYETGTYTEMTRFILTGIYPAIKNMQFQLMTSNWNELSDYQKKQIIKGVSELAITAAILPAIMMILAGLQGGEDDDDWTWYLTLITRRLQSELSSYRNINEQWRVLKSPIPSMQVLEGTTNLMFRIFDPTSWNEKFESGNNKDRYKITRDVEKLIPVLNSRSSTYKSKYQFINNRANL